MSAQPEISRKYKVLSIKGLYILFTLLLTLLLTTNYLLPTVHAGHQVGEEGWYCDVNELWHDVPDGTHEFEQDCAATGQICQESAPPAGYIGYADCVAPDTYTTPYTTPDDGDGTYTTPPPSNIGIGDPEGTPISNSNYRAPQHSNYTFINLEHTLFCELVGASPVEKCVGLKKDRDQTSLFLFDKVPGGGALGSLTSFVTALYHPPTSTAQYLADLGENLGIVKPAYAQVGGSGAGIIEPIRALWQVTRNIAYIAFIIVFVIIGFMIMFRTRINPQTVISAQAALPGLVVGLILVTFSYFVAALLIDIAFISIQIVGNIFLQVKDSSGNIINVFDIPGKTRDSNIFNMFVDAIRLKENIADLFGGTLRTFFSADGATSPLFIVPAAIGAVVGTIFIPVPILGTLIGGGIGTVAIPALIGLLVPLVLIIALFIQFFRLLFGLIGSYIALLVLTVLGPFMILISSIPGRGGVLSVWWRTLLGNTLVFPAVFAAFLFAGLVLGTPIENWNASPPLFGGLSTELLRLIIAYGIILGTPAIPGMVRRALGVPELQGIPQAAIGGALAGFGVAQGGGTRLIQPALREAQGYREAVIRQRYTPPPGDAVPQPAGRLARLLSRL